MNKPLRILHLEDDPDYADLVCSLLEKDELQAEVIVVSNRADFEAALAGETFDLILADYLLPDCNGLQALSWAQQKRPQIPFLLVSGTIGEQAAIESLKCGATDYVLKHWPERLVPAIRRAAEEAAERTQRQRVEAELGESEKQYRLLQGYTPNAFNEQDSNTLQMLADNCGGALKRIAAEQALRDSKRRFRDLFDGSPDAIFVEGLDGGVLDVNPAACQLHGATRKELIGKSISDLVPPELQEKVARDFKAVAEGKLRQVEGVTQTLDGRAIPVEIRANCVEYGGQSAVLLHVRDITERKLAEAALRSSEMLFHSVWENSADGMRLTDEQGNIVAVNQAFCNLVGMCREELEGNPFTVIVADSEQRQNLLDNYRQRFLERVVEKPVERRLTLRNGNVVTFEDTTSFVELRGQPSLLLGLFRDVTGQKRLEDQLRQSQKMDAIGQLAGGVAQC